MAETQAPPPAEHVLVIAEIAQAHDGSLGTAHAYVDAVAKAGADVVKFQTHIAAAESTPSEPWRVRFGPREETRYEYWKRMEFTEAEWLGLRQHALKAGVDFLSSPFSLEALELLERVGVMGWKVASGEVRNLPMLNRMAATHLPILLSTGMSPLGEIDEAVALLRQRGVQELTVMQCTSAYPTPPEKVGLNLLPVLRERYGCAVGLSDHSGTIWPSLAAVALGASVVEVHVTFSHDAFGPDVASSVTVEELRRLVEGVRFLERARSGVDKDAAAAELAPMRKLFMKSVVARRGLTAGTVLDRADLAAKKPGTGIPADRLPSLVGRRLARDVSADALLTDEDLEA